LYTLGARTEKRHHGEGLAGSSASQGSPDTQPAHRQAAIRGGAQGFGTLKRSYRFGRVRYLGRLKTEIEFHLLAMAFNLKKAVGLMAT